MARITQTYSTGLRFIANVDSMDALAGGATVNIPAFTDAKFGVAGQRLIPAGTAVKLDPVTGFAIPADATGPAFLMASDVVENAFFLRGSDGTTGLYAGGIVYENELIDAVANVLPAPIKAALGPKFTFQNSPGAIVYIP